jgi:hypothetical protein
VTPVYFLIVIAIGTHIIFAGYAVEIGLKAAIAGEFRANTIPEKKFVNDIYSHDLRKLVDAAGLTRSLAEEMRRAESDAKWATVENWKPEDRYAIATSVAAKAMVAAVDDPNDGVFKWIRSHW